MSQVIVTKDNFSDKREASAEQEHKIAKDDAYRKWQKSDITKPNPILKLIGLAALPVVAIWGLILACMSFAFAIVVYMLKGLGKIFSTGK